MTTDQEVYRPLPEIVAAANVKSMKRWPAFGHSARKSSDGSSRGTRSWTIQTSPSSRLTLDGLYLNCKGDKAGLV